MIKRNVFVDLLRILSCFAVVGFHCFSKEDSPTFLFYRLCGFLIPMFFLLSGYFLLQKKNSCSEYIYRIKKIFYLIVGWNVLYWVFALIYSYLSNTLESLIYFELFRSITDFLFQKNVFWHFWFLGSLLIIYLCLPLIHKILFVKNNEINMRRLYCLWFVLFIVGFVMQAISSFFLHYSLQSLIDQCFRLWTWFQYFLFGGILYWEQSKWLNKINLSYKFMLFITLVAIIYPLLISFQYNMLLAENYYDSIVIFFWVISIFIFVMNYRLSDKIIKFVNNFSPFVLGIYIIHPLFIGFFKDYLLLGFLQNSFICYFTSIAFSVIVTYFMKKLPVLCKLV